MRQKTTVTLAAALAAALSWGTARAHEGHEHGQESKAPAQAKADVVELKGEVVATADKGGELVYTHGMGVVQEE